MPTPSEALVPTSLPRIPMILPSQHILHRILPRLLRRQLLRPLHAPLRLPPRPRALKFRIPRRQLVRYLPPVVPPRRHNVIPHLAPDIRHRPIRTPRPPKVRLLRSPSPPSASSPDSLSPGSTPHHPPSICNPGTQTRTDAPAACWPPSRVPRSCCESRSDQTPPSPTHK